MLDESYVPPWHKTVCCLVISSKLSKFDRANFGLQTGLDLGSQFKKLTAIDEKTHSNWRIYYTRGCHQPSCNSPLRNPTLAWWSRQPGRQYPSRPFIAFCTKTLFRAKSSSVWPDSEVRTFGRRSTLTVHSIRQRCLYLSTKVGATGDMQCASLATI